MLEASEASFDRLIGINLKGPYFLTQRAAPLMMPGAPLAGFPRAVVNVTSISAFTASVNRGDYCIAKAGLSMMTKLYAARLAGEGIDVFEIQPGVIATDMTGAVKEKYDRLFAEGLAPINRWGQPSGRGPSRRRHRAAADFPTARGKSSRWTAAFICTRSRTCPLFPFMIKIRHRPPTRRPDAKKSPGSGKRPRPKSSPSMRTTGPANPRPFSPSTASTPPGAGRSGRKDLSTAPRCCNSMPRATRRS